MKFDCSVVEAAHGLPRKATLSSMKLVIFELHRFPNSNCILQFVHLFMFFLITNIFLGRGEPYPSMGEMSGSSENFHSPESTRMNH